MLLFPVASLVCPSGLHDNPWVCDCRLYDLVQFQKFPTLSVAFIDTRLRCSAPESVSGVLFSDTELRRCQLPRIHTAVARVRSAVGNNVLLRCGTIGVPIPDLTWHRADGRSVNGSGESLCITFHTVSGSSVVLLSILFNVQRKLPQFLHLQSNRKPQKKESPGPS